MYGYVTEMLSLMCSSCLVSFQLDVPMFSRICFVHPSRPSLSRVFYVTLTAEQAESMQKVGRADASARYPFFDLKEQKEHGS